MSREFFGQTNIGPAIERAADTGERESDDVLDSCPEELRAKILAARKEERRGHRNEATQSENAAARL